MIKKNKNQNVFFLVSVFFTVIGFFVSLRFGAVSDFTISESISLRLPRVVLSFAVGAGLSIAGVVMQALFSNPLSDPYTLGVSSGGALGAVVGLTLFPGFVFMGVSPFSFFGSLLFSFLLMLFAKKYYLKPVSLLLMGVMLGFLGSALVAIWMSIAEPLQLQTLISWMMGDLSRAKLQTSFFVFCFVSIIVCLLWLKSRELDLFLLGDQYAKTMGLDIVKFRLFFIFLISVLVALLVSVAGLIGFVGLMVPHFVRKVLGSRHRIVVPFSFVWGGLFLMICDLVSRIILPPQEFAVGALTALMGAPIFVYLYFNSHRDGDENSA